MNNLILSVACRGQKGIVAAISTFLAENNCNITASSQFDDPDGGQFFMRIGFVDENEQGIKALTQKFEAVKNKFAMQARFHNKTEKMKILVMVSKFGHCLHDLLYRQHTGTLPVEIVAIVSNHTEFENLANHHKIPFHHIAVTKETKLEAEEKLKTIFYESKVELIVLARYMQILSRQLSKELSGKIINIHHSFLPGFKGANPYKQAHQRGVKLIGATAHYVTADLDEGPIIEQDVIRVSHAQSASDFVAIGRDVEAQVLARAILAHSQHRTFIDGNKVIVFPAAPGDYSIS